MDTENKLMELNNILNKMLDLIITKVDDHTLKIYVQEKEKANSLLAYITEDKGEK